MTAVLEFGFEDFEKVKRAFSPEVVEKAMRTTVTRTARKARTEVSKQIRQVYTIKAGTVKETVSLSSRSTPDGRVSVLQYRGGPLPIDRFSRSLRSVSTPRGRRPAVSVRVKKSGGRKLVRGGFPLRGRAAGKNGNPTMQRTTDDRLPIERVFSLSVPQMVNADVQRAAEKKFAVDANIELNRNLRFFQERAR